MTIPALTSLESSTARGGSTDAVARCDRLARLLPHGPEIVAVLMDAGGDPDAAVKGRWHSETPLHWAASSDDVEVVSALIDRGAAMDAPGASITGRTLLDDAVGYGCWQVARLLVDRGARVDHRWHAAALGMISRVQELLPPSRQPASSSATLSGRPATAASERMAEYLLVRGADLNGTPHGG